MGLFDFLRKREKEERSLNNPAVSMNDIWARQDSGKVVNKEVALTLPAFYAANNIIGESIAQVPLNVFRRTDKGAEIDRTHPLQRLLHTEPNLYQTSFVWRHAMSVHATCGGNGISQIIRKGDDISLHNIPSQELKEVYITKKGTPIYVFEKDGKEREIAGRDLIHIPNYTIDGVRGIGWLASANKTVRGGVSQQTYGNSVHENNGNIGGVFTTPKRLSDAARISIKQQYRSGYEGADNAGKTLFLEEDMKFQKMPITLEEAQLIESKSFTVEEMSRVSRIPMHLLSSLANATFSNIEQQSLEFITYCLLPWVKKWEMELNKKLLTEDEKSTHFIKFNLSALQRADIDSRGKYYAAMVNTGVMTRNEVRELENMNKLEGLDIPLQPLNFTAAEGETKPETENETEENEGK